MKKYLILFTCCFGLFGCGSEVVLEEPIDLTSLDSGSLTYIQDSPEYATGYIYKSDKEVLLLDINSSTVIDVKDKTVYKSDDSVLYLDNKTGVKYSELTETSFVDAFDKSDVKDITKKDIEYLGVGYEVESKKSSTVTKIYDYEAYFYNKTDDEYYEVDITEGDYVTNLLTFYLDKPITVSEIADGKGVFLFSGFINLNGYWMPYEKSSSNEIDSNLSDSIYFN